MAGVTEGRIKAEAVAGRPSGSARTPAALDPSVCRPAACSVNVDELRGAEGGQQCSKGEYSCAEAGALRTHVHLRHAPHERIAWHRCKHCRYKAKRKPTLQSHMRLVHRGESAAAGAGRRDRLQCDKCAYQSTSEPTMRKHVALVHLQPPRQNQVAMKKSSASVGYSMYYIFHCDRCEYLSWSELDMMLHQHQLHDFPLPAAVGAAECSWDKPFRCEVCLRSFKREDLLRQHMYMRHTPDHLVHWLPCAQCSYKAKRPADLKAHQLLHAARDQASSGAGGSGGAAPVWHECGQCEYRTPRRDHLKVHTQLKHTPHDQLHWLHCPLCQYKCKAAQQMRAHNHRAHKLHVLSEKNTNGENAQLSLELPQQVQGRRAFKRHAPKRSQPQRGSSQRRLACAQCPYVSSRRELLQMHLVYKHTAPEHIQWHSCDQCAYQCKQPRDLRRHMRTHQDKPAEDSSAWRRCGECAYKTLKGSNLRAHHQLKHVPPELATWWHCHLCTYKARRKHSVDKHKIRCERKRLKALGGKAPSPQAAALPVQHLGAGHEQGAQQLPPAQHAQLGHALPHTELLEHQYPATSLLIPGTVGSDFYA